MTCCFVGDSRAEDKKEEVSVHGEEYALWRFVGRCRR
jgi:hypothetical protein